MKKKKISIKIPKNIKYLTDYPNLLTLLPRGNIMLDKTITGCGATSLFLSDNVPTILCSPRNALMYCKAESDEYKGRVHLFRTKDDDDRKTPVIDLENRMMGYIRQCQASSPFVPEKILVSYDSFKHVAQRLHDDGTLFRYRIVVDEAHTLFSDAAFKGEVEIEFLSHLQLLTNVIYLTATPYIENYLNSIQVFSGLPYVELVWPESSRRHYNIIKSPYYQGSVKKTAVRIIEDYQRKGYFAEKLVGGVPVYSQEAVFFLNEVKTVLAIIDEQRLGLTPDNTNIICAYNEDNKKQLAARGFKIGQAQRKGDQHKTYTFATKCAYEGVDFYHPSAYTYIFSDINKDHLSVDLSVDLVQILGRGRMESNPFLRDATLFYKTSLSFDAEGEKAFIMGIKDKYSISEWWRDIYNRTADPALRLNIAATLRRDQKTMQFKEHYATVIDDTINGSVEVVINDLAMCNECRAWQIQKAQYQSYGSVMASVEDAVPSILDYPIIAAFLKAFTGDYEFRLKTYCETLRAYPGYKEYLESLPQIPMAMKVAYNTLGPDCLRSLSYVQADIERHLQWLSSEQELVSAVKASFSPDQFYTLQEIKSKLQSIYDALCPGRIAKATDLETLIPCESCREKSLSGNREHGYRIGKGLNSL